MKEFKFNEQLDIENMISTGYVDRKNINNTIYKVAKYNYHILGMSDEDNYTSIIGYITSNRNDIIEAMIYKNVDNSIKNAKKHAMANVDCVNITESELMAIGNEKDIKKQKILFVLLAVAKYLNELSGKPNDNAYLSSPEIFKMARVTIASKERDKFMQFAYDDGFLIRHFSVSSNKKILSYVSHDPDDKVILKLEESDFSDLAYTYMAFLEPHKFRRCHTCRRWMRINKNGSTICRPCANASEAKKMAVKSKIRVGFCADCGKAFTADYRNASKFRCDRCQSIANKENARKRQKKYIESRQKMTPTSDKDTIQN